MASAQNLKEAAIYGWSRARSLGFFAESLLLRGSARKLFGRRPPVELDRATILELDSRLRQLLKEDAAQIAAGLLPVSALKPEKPWSHLRRIPKLIGDGLAIEIRRKRGRTAEFEKRAKEYLEELPRYYRRNFHFQTDGYLSEASAELYDHQVEILFQGTADAMRRLILRPMKEHFGGSDGKGLRILEIGAGTGRATRFTRLAFPKAKITALDLSDPYLKTAQRKLGDLPRIDFVQGDGGALPFQDQGFDAVYSVFLFHELPLEARNDVLRESMRVLKPGGFFGMVDSAQKKDVPGFEDVLDAFPQEFHEPYYRNYIDTPMEDLVRGAGYGPLGSKLGFFSKCVWGSRSATPIA